MGQSKTKVLTGAMLFLLALVPGRAEAQCVACGKGKIVKHETCQPATTGANECATYYDEMLGWICLNLDWCRVSAMQEGEAPSASHEVAPPARPVLGFSSLAWHGEGISAGRAARQRVLVTCGRGVIKRFDERQTIATTESPSIPFQL